MVNYFKGVGQVKASNDANYITPGRYKARIERVETKENKDGSPIFVIELFIAEVLGVDLLEGLTPPGCMNGKPTRTNKQGEIATHLIPFTGKGATMALPNIKAFASVVVDGFNELAGQVDDDGNDKQELLLQMICGEDQPLAGTEVEVYARSIKTRASTDFTKITYVEVLPSS